MMLRKVRMLLALASVTSPLAAQATLADRVTPSDKVKNFTNVFHGHSSAAGVIGNLRPGESAPPPRQRAELVRHRLERCPGSLSTSRRVESLVAQGAPRRWPSHLRGLARDGESETGGSSKYGPRGQ